MSEYLKWCVAALDLAIQENRTREDAVRDVLEAGRLSKCPEAVDMAVAKMTEFTEGGPEEAIEVLRAAEDAALGKKG